MADKLLQRRTNQLSVCMTKDSSQNMNAGGKVVRLLFNRDCLSHHPYRTGTINHIGRSTHEANNVADESVNKKTESEQPKKKEYKDFRDFLGTPEAPPGRAKTPIGKLDEIKTGIHPYAEKEPLLPWPEGVNPSTGEEGGPKGPEPTRYGDWERKGRVSDF